MAWNRKRQLARQRLDEKLALLRPADRHIAPSSGWIRALRDALGMPTEHLAQLVGVRRQSIGDLEASEARGSITLDTLRRVGAAMDCTLVYALVPNQPLQDIVETRAQTLAHAARAATAHTMALEDQFVASQPSDLTTYIEDHISERDLWSGK